MSGGMRWFTSSKRRRGRVLGAPLNLLRQDITSGCRTTIECTEARYCCAKLHASSRNYMRSWPTISFAGSIFSVLFLSLSLAAQTPIEPSVPAGATPDAPKATSNEPIGTITVGKRDQIRIGGGDLIEVSLYGVPDFKQELRVSESGDISLPLVGGVGVAGRTPEEAQVEIAK